MEEELELIRKILVIAECSNCDYREKCDEKNKCQCFQALERIRAALNNNC